MSMCLEYEPASEPLLISVYSSSSCIENSRISGGWEVAGPPEAQRFLVYNGGNTGASKVGVAMEKLRAALFDSPAYARSHLILFTTTCNLYTWFQSMSLHVYLHITYQHRSVQGILLKEVDETCLRMKSAFEVGLAMEELRTALFDSPAFGRSHLIVYEKSFNLRNLLAIKFTARMLHYY